ncbi:MFS transporter, partial [Klebsiella pneumoniae]|nr:MFS transporter [Klebsiella pneumoniae]
TFSQDENADFHSTFASAIIAPGRAKIQQELQISRTVSVFPYSIFSLGVAVGSVVGSPASEKYGRQPIFRLSMSLLLIFVMAAGFSHDLPSL